MAVVAFCASLLSLTKTMNLTRALINFLLEAAFKLAGTSPVVRAAKAE